MKPRALLLVSVFAAWTAVPALCGVAAAQPAPGAAGDVFRIEVPRTWTPQPDLAAQITAELRAVPPVAPEAGAPRHVAAQAWAGDGAGLVVTWIAVEPRADAPEPAARALLDHVRHAPEHASLEAGDTALQTWTEAMHDGMADARMVWTHARNQTVTRSRALVFSSARGRLHLVRADCVTGDAGEAEAGAETARTGAAARCDQLLGSLTIAPPASERKPLGTLPPAAPVARAADATAESGPATGAEASPATAGASGTAPSEATPSIREPALEPGKILVLEPGARAPDRSHQWLYVLGGVLIVIAVYLTTRSREPEPSEEDDDGDGDEDGGGDEEKRS